ncbi:hypothetical protein FWG95_02550 [Candidatus Saccharibacteria bacterium]|nr:hypothetical protein [Candidatus Saccharibacteria bacterium]
MTKDINSEYEMIRRLAIENDISRDKTLMQLTIGFFAVISTLGISILKHNFWLALAIILLFGISTFIQYAGFFATRKSLGEIMDNLSSGKIDSYKTSWSRLITLLNVLAFATFTAGVICFIILLIFSLV